MPIDWAGYVKTGVSIAPKVIDGLKSIAKKRDLLVVLPDWSGTQQRVWHNAVEHGVKRYQLEIDLRARLENGGAEPRTVKAVTVTLSQRRYGRLFKVAESSSDWFSSTKTARILQSFDDAQHNTIRVEPHSLTDPYYFRCRVPLPKGLVSLDRNYVATVRFHTVGNKRVVVSIPIHCPDPFINMGFNSTSTDL